MVTQDSLLERFYYIDGVLHHKYNKNYRTKKGDIAGSVNSAGYMFIVLKGVKFLAHRAVFLMINGKLPKYIDHIDGNKLNNKIENLRACTFSQNVCNKPKPKNNTSGEKGVYWDKNRGKWKVQMELLGKQHHFGRFINFDDAKAEAIFRRKE